MILPRQLVPGVAGVVACIARNRGFGRNRIDPQSRRTSATRSRSKVIRGETMLPVATGVDSKNAVRGTLEILSSSMAPVKNPSYQRSRPMVMGYQPGWSISPSAPEDLPVSPFALYTPSTYIRKAALSLVTAELADAPAGRSAAIIIT